MDPRKQTTCTRRPWTFSSMSGTGITGCVLTPTRTRIVLDDRGRRLYKFQNGQLYGTAVTIADYDAREAEIKRLSILYGYCQYYGRNTCGFVMSRAARKRGHTTKDIWYNGRKERHAAELEARRTAAGYDRLARGGV